jgi:predicted RNA binding protein YcfA (HicA-like mRNA interferase family)
MAKVPIDAPIGKVIKTLENLGFRLVREGNHIAMVRENPDGTQTPLTVPNHKQIKSSTLRTMLTQAGISRDSNRKTHIHQLIRVNPETFSLSQENERVLTETMDIA